jgi:serine protease Do
LKYLSKSASARPVAANVARRQVSSASMLFDAALARVGEKISQSTVQILDGRRGAGSGVVWRAGGWIITNAHVVRTPRAKIHLPDGRKFDAQLVARDPERDLAALRADEFDLPIAEIGASTELRVGQLVIAVGCPYGLRGAVSAGVVHAIGTVAAIGDRQWIQADLELAPGNSGGPLADANGRVIGINAMIAGGLGLAIPSYDVEQFLRRAMERRRAA